MTEQTVSSNEQKPNPKLSISLDFRLLCVVLLVVIVAMLALWRPWDTQVATNARTITVSGESTVKSAPDVFVFSPTYEVTNTDKAAASDALIAKQTEVVAGLKKLGVADSKIKSDTSGYSNSYIDDTTGLYHYSSNIQITIDTNDKALTQKVQDYLVSTVPTGTISPYGSFSDNLRKKLETQGRDVATKEARAKADQSAKNLGFKVGSVKSVSDDNGNGGVTPMYSTLESGSNLSTDAKQSLSVQAGENDLTYSVTVVYYLK